MGKVDRLLPTGIPMIYSLDIMFKFLVSNEPVLGWTDSTQT